MWVWESENNSSKPLWRYVVFLEMNSSQNLFMTCVFVTSSPPPFPQNSSQSDFMNVENYFLLACWAIRVFWKITLHFTKHLAIRACFYQKLPSSVLLNDTCLVKHISSSTLLGDTWRFWKTLPFPENHCWFKLFVENNFLSVKVFENTCVFVHNFLQKNIYVLLSTTIGMAYQRTWLLKYALCAEKS